MSFRRSPSPTAEDIDLDRERARTDAQWRAAAAEAHMPLAVAAALTFHQVNGNTKAIRTRQEYDDALNIAAMALSRLIPVYGMGDPREGRHALSVDLGKQSFVRGATRLRTGDAVSVMELSIRRADLASAIGLLKRRGMPFLVPPSYAQGASVPLGPRANRLLAALPDEDYSRLVPHLEHVPLRSQQILYAEGAEQRHSLFPVSGVISVLYVAADGESTEIAVIGDDGIVGLAALFGSGSSPRRVVVQVEGHAYRLRGDALLEEFHRNGALQSLLLRYLHALMCQMSQTAVCNRHHTVEQQLCRWLLLSLDRVPSNEVLMTQELISQMLGVRRAGITEAAKKLERLRLIRYSRGRITVPERTRLEAHACECYAVVKKETDRLFPPYAGVKIPSP